MLRALGQFGSLGVFSPLTPNRPNEPNPARTQTVLFHSKNPLREPKRPLLSAPALCQMYWLPFFCNLGSIADAKHAQGLRISFAKRQCLSFIEGKGLVARPLFLWNMVCAVSGGGWVIGGK